MLELFTHCCLISMAMYIWFDTNAFYEFFKKMIFFDKDCFKPYEDYLKATGLDSLFSEYLVIENNFFSKILSCPTCLSVWMCLVFAIPLGILKIGMYFIISNIFYFGFRKIILLLNERNP